MTTTSSTPRRDADPASAATRRLTSDAVWLRRLRLGTVVGVISILVLGVTNLFATTTDQGPFRYPGDYWLTASGLPVALARIVIAWSVHRLQHGADGPLGSAGVWLNTLALAELFVQLTASVVVGRELQWGAMYIIATGLTFLGTALLAAGSWGTGLAPRWMLGLWPLLWVLGSFAAVGPVPAVLAAFLIALTVTITRSVHRRGDHVDSSSPAS